MNEEISNSRLATKLKRYIRKTGQIKKLPNIYHCGSRVIRQLGAEPAVFIMKDQDNNTRYFGHTSCHSAWACPRCTAKVMAEKGSNIACLIDALAKWKNQYCFMATYTLPHTKYMTCEQAFTIIKKTWRLFTRGTKRKLYSTFRHTLNIKYCIRVYEFTYGENGWHPHLHVLYWTDKKNFYNGKIMGFAERLVESFWCSATYTAKKILGNEYTESVYAEWKKYPKTGHRVVYISTDANGNPVIQKSSRYISGWSGDKELTKEEQKKASEGHLTPYQIILKTEEDPENADKWLDLYTEYAKATFKSRRVEFTKAPGEESCQSIIKKWKATQDYIETFKKKLMAKEKKWQVAYWFDEQQWSLISFLEVTTNHYIKSEILTRAPNKQELEDYLIQLGIPLTTRKHKQQMFIENAVFNGYIFDPQERYWFDPETGELIA